MIIRWLLLDYKEGDGFIRGVVHTEKHRAHTQHTIKWIYQIKKMNKLKKK